MATHNTPSMRFLVYVLLCFPLFLAAQREEFSNFTVAVELNDDGSLHVLENITAVSAGDKIKRGITRALPRAPLGDDAPEMPRFDYEILSVGRDGSNEDHHTKNENGSKVVYFGSKNRFLEDGQHRFTLEYTAPQQIYFLPDRNEVRWTLAGSDTQLPIQSASLTLTLPGGLEVLATACYTGVVGSTEQACEMVKRGNQITYTLTRPLAAGEGMVVAAGFPVGSFAQPPPPPPPTALQEKGTLYACFLGLFAALFYGYRTWQQYGVDPPTPEVGPQFTAPRGLSPASVHYLNSSMPSQTQLTASLTDLAIKGYLKIDEEERNGIFTNSEIFVLRPIQKEPVEHQDLAPEQIALYQYIRNMGDIELDGKYDKRLAKATEAHNESLKEQHKDYLKQGSNLNKVWPFPIILFVSLVLGGFFINTASTAGIILFALAILMLLVGSFVFGYLVRQPSEDKVRLWAEIKALKNYLKLSEEKRRAVPGAPPMTEAYFQEVLPYAIALGIENNWAADLQSDLAGTLNDDRRRGSYYYPYMMPGFGNKMNTAYGAVSSPPGSSGGGGGSVSSGGGSGGW